jgi:integrase
VPVRGVGSMDAAVKPTWRYLRRPLTGTAQTYCSDERTTGYTLMNLTWPDVDIPGRRITLHETKNGERRVVPLSGHAVDAVRAIPRRIDTILLFPGKVKRNKPIDLRVPWRAALKSAEITDFRWHDLRHSTASYLAMTGATPVVIAEVLGHKTLQMVKRYAHLSEAHTAGVVESMNKKIFG